MILVLRRGQKFPLIHGPGNETTSLLASITVAKVLWSRTEAIWKTGALIESNTILTTIMTLCQGAYRQPMELLSKGTNRLCLIDVDHGTATLVVGHEIIAIVVNLGSEPLPVPIW